MKLIEIESTVKYIVLEEQVYLRVGPNCWYYKEGTDYLAVAYIYVLALEKVYQKLKEQND